MNNKFTDEEIINSLENCINKFDSCNTCIYREIQPCSKAQIIDCLDIIRRQKAEIEQFEQNMKNVLEIEKKNAMKEFAEKIKLKSYVNNYCREVVEIEKIDELLNEFERNTKK